jgi:hypothetical protein
MTVLAMTQRPHGGAATRVLDLLKQQREQHTHDMRNHFDIISLGRIDRLKHYGLHYAKYVGRISRGHREPISVERTLTDLLLICLSSANALQQRLTAGARAEFVRPSLLESLANAVGRFADGCEKIDHLEESLEILKDANSEILLIVLAEAEARQLDLLELLAQRRAELSERVFYVE